MIYFVLCRLLSPLRLVDRRIPLLDRILRIKLPDSELEGIHEACRREGRRLGHFYHWKAVNALLLECMKRLDAAGIRRLIARAESADRELPELAEGRGAIFAIPHHGHFVMAIISLAEKLARSREVYIFYESPGSHQSNALFDLLHDRIFAAEGSLVNVVHNDRRGLATALRALDRGAALVILPDVYKDVTDTYIFPFQGWQLHAMLGTATIARKTGSMVFPVVSRPTLGAWGFRTVVGNAVEPASDVENSTDPDERLRDYEVTYRLFEAFGELMKSNLVYWQYAGSLYAHAQPFKLLDLAAVEASEELMLADPRLRISTTSAISLEPCGEFK